MKVKAAAKINLMLDVVGVLPNGYHSLYMIMQSVDCYDYVRVDRTEKFGYKKIITDDPRVPTDEKEYCIQGGKGFFLTRRAFVRTTALKLKLKSIFRWRQVLQAEVLTVQALFLPSTSYSTQGFLPLSCVKSEKKVGADVPFSIHGGTALCTDIGSVIAPLPDLDNCYVLICKPPVDVSTLGAYKLIDEAKRLRHGDRCGMLYAMKHNDRELMYKKRL